MLISFYFVSLVELDDNVLIQLDATTDNGMDNTVFRHY